MTATPLLLSPFRIGHVELRNRVVMAPHSTHYADRTESPRLTAYYLERAREGVGLIVHEPVIVHPSSLSRAGKIWGYDEANVEAYRATTDAVHQAGARIVCQLIHNGRQVDGHESRMPAWYPSEVAKPGTVEVTHPMTRDEIAEVVDGFVTAARICQQGGFDGIEVHAAHGYLLQAFLSPATNSRTDEYGGSLENRTRIVREVIAAIRAEVGREFVIGVRLTGDEFQPGGLGAADCVEVAAVLASDVDYVSVVSGSLASYDRIVPDMSFERHLNAGYAEAIRHRIAPVPVLVTGRIAEPDEAEQVLAEGQADLVGLARALIADPAWVRKAASGRSEDIRPCVYANDCRDSIGGRRSLVCMVNPRTGNELELLPAPSRRRRVVVIGGGPAGMEAATTAADAGDEVILFERSGVLGGQLGSARSSPGRADLGRLERHLVARVGASADIDLRYENADPASVQALHPDLVVLATGATGMPGAPEAAATAWEVLDGAEVEGPVVVVADRSGGNGWPLFLAAEVLAARGHQVVLAVPGSTLASAVEAASVPPLLRRLKQAGVRIELLTSVRSAGPDGVTLRRSDTDADLVLPGAALVEERGRRVTADPGPWQALAASSGWTLKIVGDALAPRRIAPALVEARSAVLG